MGSAEYGEEGFVVLGLHVEEEERGELSITVIERCQGTNKIE